MRKSRKRSFQTSIQNTFFAYAIIPVFAILVIAFLLARLLLYSSVERDCRRLNGQISGRLQTLCENYAAGLDQFCARADVALCLREGAVTRALFEDLYDFLNAQEIRADFFLLNSKLELLGASTRRIPEYLSGERLQRRAAAQGPGASMAWERTGGEYGGALLFAAAAGDDGFVVFHLAEAHLQAVAAGRGSLNVLLTNGMNYVVWKTDDTLVDAYNRIVPEARRFTGGVEYAARQLYVSADDVFGGRIDVYTVADTTVFGSVFAVLGWALMGILTLMTLMIFWVSRRIARDKTKVINQIVETMGSARGGALPRALEINTGDEFEKIANTYNRMCQDIQSLLDDNAEIAREQMLSEIKQLESQFNPHFLFNTLETIKFLVRIDAAQAQLAILKLSEILRYSLAGAATVVKLTDEVHYTDCYLALQKLRFGDQLQYAIAVEKAAETATVPKLILQPLVENAIRYGCDEMGNCKIDISVRQVGGDLAIDVCDGGAPLRGEDLERVRALIDRKPEETGHVGLYNVHRRVQLIYKAPYGVAVLPTREGNTFRITLPASPGKEGSPC